MLTVMTGLALLAHSATAADPGFNYTFYATVATIIPVFFIAIAIEKTIYQGLVDTMARVYDQSRAAIDAGDFSRRQMKNMMMGTALQIITTVILFAGIVGETISIFALYQQQISPGSRTAVLVTVFISAAAVAMGPLARWGTAFLRMFGGDMLRYLKVLRLKVLREVPKHLRTEDQSVDDGQNGTAPRRLAGSGLPPSGKPETEEIPHDPAGDPQPPPVVQAALPADAAALGQAGHIPRGIVFGPDGGTYRVHLIKALTTAGLRADAEASPDTTVVSAWAYVETAISDLARVLGISDVPSFALDADAVLSELARRGARPGPESTRSVLRRLLRRRTSVMRGEHVSAAEAYDFGADALHVTDLLLGAYAKTQGKPGPGLPPSGKPETEEIPHDPPGDPQPPSVVQAALPADAAALGQAGHIPRGIAIGPNDRGGYMMCPIKTLTTASLRADAEASPDTTVVSAWAYVETAISDLARVLGISDVPSFALDADAVLSELARRGARPGPESTRSVLRRLLRRRTSVERGEHVSAAEAYDFGADALHVTDLLLGAYAKTQGKPGPGLPD